MSRNISVKTISHPAVRPPDTYAVGVGGSRIIELDETEARELADQLIDLLDIQLCTGNGDAPGSECCCTNCPWGNVHEYPRPNRNE